MSIRDELINLTNEIEEDDYDLFAGELLDLILDRYAVIELPILPEPDDDGQIYLAEAGLRIDTTGQRGAEIFTEDGHQLSPEQLRFYAAEYLSAANRAETQS